MNIRFDFYTLSKIADILGERLKTQRLALNLIQAALAEKAGIGISNVARIETGQGGTLDNIIRGAIGLGMINHFAELFDITSTSIEDIIVKQNPRLRASNKS